MRIRWIVVAAAAVMAIGVGVAWAAIPDSDGSVQLCAGPETSPAPTGLYGPVYMTDAATPCHSGQTRVKVGATGPAGARGDTGPAGPAGPAGAAGAGAAVPQVYETFGSGGVSLNNKALKLSLALPVGTYDVDASFAGSATDLHEKPVYDDKLQKIISYDVVPRAMSVFCKLDSPGRESTSAGAAPIGSGAVSTSDHATVSLTAPATLTFSCLGDDYETSQQSNDPKNGLINAGGASHLSATMISSSAVPAVIRVDGPGVKAQTKAAISKVIALTDASDAGNDKKVDQILSKLKALATK